MLTPYLDLLRRPGMVPLVLLGMVLRLPFFAAGVIVTLHVVTTLERSYAEAGLVTAALLVGIGVGGPYRGRLLDRVGLRRVAIPCLLVQILYAGWAPFAPYAVLLVLGLVAGTFMIPVMSIMRQAMIAGVPTENRRTALSLDGMVVELSAMLAPAASVWGATVWGTTRTLVVVFGASAIAGAVLIVINPPMKSAGASLGGPTLPMRSWMRPGVVAILVGGAASTAAFTGTDLGVVALLREWDAAHSIGWVMALWAAGSLIGGLVYGALGRSGNAFVLLAGLALLTMLPVLAGSALSLGALIVLTGLLGQPAITSALEYLTDAVPEAARGEAMGWHSTAMTGGSALGAPVAGLAIDRVGADGGFVSVALLALSVAIAGMAALSWRHRARTDLL